MSSSEGCSPLLATYAEDAQLLEHPAKLLATGLVQMRERYAARFKEPNLHAAIVKRIVMGNVVVDHERVTRTFPEGTGVHPQADIPVVQLTIASTRRSLRRFTTRSQAHNAPARGRSAHRGEQQPRAESHSKA